MPENVGTLEEQLSVEALTSPILDFPEDTELFTEALLQSSEASSYSCSDGTDRNISSTGACEEEGFIASAFSSFYTSLDASSLSDLLEAQTPPEAEPGDLIDFSQPPPTFSIEDQQEQLDQMVAMTVSANGMEGNRDVFNEYTPDSMVHQLPVPPLPDPQHSLMQSIYEGEHLLTPLASAATAYLFTDATMGSLYHGRGMGLLPCGGGGGGGGGEGQGFFPGGIAPVVPQEMEYQNIGVGGIYDLDFFQQHGYSSTDVQLLGDRGPQQQHQQQQNNMVVGDCSSPTPLASDISALDESTFKAGRISAEERKEKIDRYMKKRNERNFSKKIKYACRKTLADSRPRVRGRFAKNEELGEMARTSTSNNDCDDDEVMVKDEELFDSSDILAHISGVNSFKYNYAVESWI